MLWYDDSSSLSYKVGYAQYAQLKGVGVWNAVHLDYNNDAQVKAFWNVLPQYKKKSFFDEDLFV